MSVTRFGVSLLNVVATIDKPASHQGTDRPDAKNSDVLLPERLEKNNAGKKQMSSVNRTMPQSMGWRCMGCPSARKTRRKAHGFAAGPAAHPRAFLNDRICVA